MCKLALADYQELDYEDANAAEIAAELIASHNRETELNQKASVAWLTKKNVAWVKELLRDERKLRDRLDGGRLRMNTAPGPVVIHLGESGG